MGQCKGKNTPKCKAIFKKYNEKGTYNKADANITPKSKKSKSVNGLSGAPKKRKTTRKSLNGLNGFGTTTWIILGVVLLALGLGGMLGAMHYKTMQMNGIIDDEEAALSKKYTDAEKKERLDKLKKLNVLQAVNFRDVLKGVLDGKLTADKMTEKQKGYYKTTGFPLPSELPIIINP